MNPDLDNNFKKALETGRRKEVSKQTIHKEVKQIHIYNQNI